MTTVEIIGSAAFVVLLGMFVFLLTLTLKQRRKLTRFQGILDVEAEQEKVKATLEAEQEEVRATTTKLQQQQNRLQTEKSSVESVLTELKKQVSLLEDEVNLQNYGLYEPKYDFESSTRYKAEIDTIRKQQKTMIRDKIAVVGNTEWAVDGNKAKGRQMVNKQIQLMSRAFNGECDSTILKVKYNNVTRIEDRIYSAYKAINKLGESQRCEINPDYLNSKIDELHLVHEYQEKLEAEKEEKRRIREQMREAERAQRELEKAQQEAEKEEERYREALDKARREIEKSTGEKHDKVQAEVQRLNELLLEAQANKERAMSRAQMTRSGHVYIISNIGSFGENVYKIGMTRRLEPVDRVAELSGPAVPFHFDIHAMIYSEDAPALENLLHKTLEKQSVNRINVRKEFFNVSLDEIEGIVRKHDIDAEFIRIPSAEEFRKTRAIIAEEAGANSSPNL